MPSAQPVAVQLRPSVEGEGTGWRQNRQVCSVYGIAKEDEIESLVSSSREISKGVEQAPPQSTLGRATSSPNAGGLSAQSVSSFDMEGGELFSVPSCGGLGNSSVTSTAKGNSGVSSDSDVNGAGKQPGVLPAVESRRLGEYIPGPQCSTILEGRARGGERRRLYDAPLGLMIVENKLRTALSVVEEAILEETLMVDRETSVEMLSENSRFCRHLRRRRPSLRGHLSEKPLSTRRRWNSMGC